MMPVELNCTHTTLIHHHDVMRKLFGVNFFPKDVVQVKKATLREALDQMFFPREGGVNIGKENFVKVLTSKDYACNDVVVKLIVLLST